MKCIQAIHRWPCVALMVIGVLCVAAQDATAPPPLSPTQLTRVRELVRVTQEQSAKLQVRLGDRQRELAAVYAVYTLNENEAQRLQKEIVKLQQELLANHHRLQVELRTLVTQERFDTLRRRLERAADKSSAPYSTEPTALAPKPQSH